MESGFGARGMAIPTMESAFGGIRVTGLAYVPSSSAAPSTGAATANTTSE